MQEPIPSDLSMTREEAKGRVFEYWHHLDALAKRRIPTSENLAHEALLYVLGKLEANDWKRVRTWEGLGHFLPFITTLASRLLTDFVREKFGYIRKPRWLTEKGDLLWETAYRLLVVEKYERQEAIEMLHSSEPHRQRWLIEEIVATIRERCRKPPQYTEQTVPIEDQQEQAAVGSTPDEALAIGEDDVLEVLRHALQADDASALPVTQRVREFLTHLNAQLRITEEDRLLLRLRYVDGLKMKAIVNLLHLKGDPYKRFNKLIAQVREACQQAGLLDDECAFGQNRR